MDTHQSLLFFGFVVFLALLCCYLTVDLAWGHPSPCSMGQAPTEGRVLSPNRVIDTSLFLDKPLSSSLRLSGLDRLLGFPDSFL